MSSAALKIDAVATAVDDVDMQHVRTRAISSLRTQQQAGGAVSEVTDATDPTTDDPPTARPGTKRGIGPFVTSASVRVQSEW